MASTEGLVPITRSYLAKFYDKYSFAPVSEDVTRLSNELRKCYRSFLSELPDRPAEELLVSEMEWTPHKIDENLWRNREQIEEILFLLDKGNWPMKLRNYWYLKWNGLLIKLMKTFGGIESRLRKYCFYLTKEIGQ